MTSLDEDIEDIKELFTLDVPSESTPDAFAKRFGKLTGFNSDEFKRIWSIETSSNIDAHNFVWNHESPIRTTDPSKE